VNLAKKVVRKIFGLFGPKVPPKIFITNEVAQNLI
jgi:hypothetical protein